MKQEGLAFLASDLTLRDIEVRGSEGPLAARLFTAGSVRKRDTLIVFFHGGGFVGGSIDQGNAFLGQLVSINTNAVGLAPAYTLAPSKPFPVAVEDAHAVLGWAKKNKAKLSWSGSRLVVAGVEAGANLAAVAALMARDRGGPPLAAQVLITPMLDPGLTTSSMRSMPSSQGKAARAEQYAAAYRNYLPNAADRTHPYASPLQASRLKNLPPAFIVSAEEDPLRDEAEQYGAKLIACGVTTTVKRLPPVPPGGDWLRMLAMDEATQHHFFLAEE
ncbi:alpha/beta hydrolase [Massilia endophytica]|uniref:alpha/beta hydrolase n=1 Tax=Massilia endophytica TaxID=2899220 RepID=UPI001E537CD2|nr:alpha/beta hydrolase [Massilia endophytica]UGQ48150.1 alpha/beta hydrolase [Massilia endophytica]